MANIQTLSSGLGFLSNFILLFTNTVFTVYTKEMLQINPPFNGAKVTQ